MDSRGIKDFIRRTAKDMGFAACGFSRASALDEEAERFDLWIRKNYHATMDYLARNLDIRRDPSHEKYFPGGKTVIVFSMGYGHEAPPRDCFAGAIARYARGKDYHDVLGHRLQRLIEETNRAAGGFHGRVFVDSAPVMEKAWARRSGIGWIGKNSLVVSERFGSYMVLGGLVTDRQIEPDAPAADGCGSCSACVEACPTGAIGSDRTVNAGLCIAYYTTEIKKIADEKLRKFITGRSAFGCDICQQVCPYNETFPAGADELQPSEIFLSMSARSILELDRSRLENVLDGTALKRAGAERIIQNVRCYLDT